MPESSETEVAVTSSTEPEPSGSGKLPESVARILLWLQRPARLGFVIFLFAFLFRLIGIGWGLPSESHHWSYHPDEPVIWGYSQRVKPIQGKLTPGFYNYGTFYLSLLSVSTDMVNTYGGGPKKEFGEDAYLAIANYHRAGRIISALAGAAMAWVVLLVLWRRTHWVGALFGSLAVAIAPGLVVHSRYQTVDVLATFLLTLGLYFALKLDTSAEKAAEPQSKSDYKTAIFSGIFFGLSAGTKYTGLLGLIALAVICVYGRKWKELAVGVLACGVAFLVTTPGILLDSAKFSRDFAFEMAHSSQGHGLVFAGTSPGYLYHLSNLAVGFGTILLVLGGIGIGRAVWKRHPWAVALALFGLAYYALIGRAEVKFLRYTFPLIPVLACGAGWLVGRTHVHPKPKWRAVGALGLLGLGGFWGGGAATAVQATSVMADNADDPRATTVTYLRNQNKDAKIGLVSDPWFYTPDFYPEAGVPRGEAFRIRNAEMNIDTKWHVVRYVPADQDKRQDWDVRLFTLKPDYIVFSSFETEGIDRLAQMQVVPAEFSVQVSQYKDFIAELQKDYELLPGDVWNPWRAVHDLMYIRPTIWVWKHKSDSPKPSSGSSTTSSTSGEPAGTR